MKLCRLYIDFDIFYLTNLIGLVDMFCSFWRQGFMARYKLLLSKKQFNFFKLFLRS